MRGIRIIELRQNNCPECSIYPIKTYKYIPNPLINKYRYSFVCMNNHHWFLENNKKILMCKDEIESAFKKINYL